MDIKPLKTPWQKDYKQGNRYNPDPFYQSREWKHTRTAFILSKPWQILPPINGIDYSNKYCAVCWREEGRIEPMHTVDHIHRIKAGGSKTDFNNMESQCKRHHAIKSANEANENKNI